jgi:hypothetical protein
MREPVFHETHDYGIGPWEVYEFDAPLRGRGSS